MTSLIVLLLLGMAVFLIASFSEQGKGKNRRITLDQDFRPYISKSPLTPTETIFYHRLVEALPDFIVLAQVQLSSFLKIDKSKTLGANHYFWFNPIAQQSVDYLICKKDFSIIAAVELDDKSHVKDSAIKRDTKKNKNLEAAKVPLIRWHAEAMPEPDTITRVILKHAMDISSTIPPQPEWLADGQAVFFKQKKNSSLAQRLIFATVLIGTSLWVIPNLINSFTRSITTQISTGQPLYRQQSQIQSASATQEILLRQQQERATQEMARVRAQQAQRALIEQQNQQKLMQAEEAALKQKAWDNYYKKSVECTNTDNIVKCGNTYIRNKQQFEYEWENERYKFR